MAKEPERMTLPVKPRGFVNGAANGLIVGVIGLAVTSASILVNDPDARVYFSRLLIVSAGWLLFCALSGGVIGWVAEWTRRWPFDTPAVDAEPDRVEYMFRQPELSDWQCKVCGVTYRPRKGDEPNAFWRMTQFLAFGIKWKRTNAT